MITVQKYLQMKEGNTNTIGGKILLSAYREETESLIREYSEIVISECAETAEEWKSQTPGFTKGYVEMIKHQI